MPEYVLTMLNMREYTLRMLNLLGYAGIYLNKQSSEYDRILNMSYPIHSIRSHYKLLSSYQDRRIQNTMKHLRWNVLQKE